MGQGVGEFAVGLHDRDLGRPTVAIAVANHAGRLTMAYLDFSEALQPIRPRRLGPLWVDCVGSRMSMTGPLEVGLPPI